MGKKKEPTHNKHAIIDRKVHSESTNSDGEHVEVIIPIGMPYVKVRRALEMALLRIR